MPLNFADRVLKYHFSLKTDIKLPSPVEWIYPFESKETKESMRLFFQKYYADDHIRHFLFGINPGRFGAGVTGVPFTDPIRLQEVCEIENEFQKRNELSSIFVYDVIKAFGGVNSFYKNFYITSVCPLGFIKNGKNYNYYDDKALEKAVEKFIIKNFKSQIKFGTGPIAYSMGQGKNFKYLKALNDKHQFFEEVIPLPHPRWVMQYRLKRKQEYIDEYLEKLNRAL